MQTLEQLLKERLNGNDPRVHTGAIEINRGKVRLLFGGYGATPRITLAIEGNDVSIIHPAPDAEPAPAPAIGEAEPAVEVVDDPAHGWSDPVYLTPVDQAAQASAANNATNAEPAADATDALNPGAAPTEGDTPVWADKDALTKDELIARAEATPGVEFNHSMTKAEIAQAINAATGAVAPAA